MQPGRTGNNSWPRSKRRRTSNFPALFVTGRPHKSARALKFGNMSECGWKIPEMRDCISCEGRALFNTVAPSSRPRWNHGTHPRTLPALSCPWIQLAGGALVRRRAAHVLAWALCFDRFWLKEKRDPCSAAERPSMKVRGSARRFSSGLGCGNPIINKVRNETIHVHIIQFLRFPRPS